MEQNHKRMAVWISILVFGVSFFYRWDFSVIASDSISIVSIALAIYTISISALIGSNFAKLLKDTPHPVLKDSTQLDVIIHYFKQATKTAILTLLLSLFIQLDHTFIMQRLNELKLLRTIDFGRIYSSLCFSCLVLNFIFIWIIFQFIINRQMENK